MNAVPEAAHDDVPTRLRRALENKRTPAADCPACDQKDTALLTVGLREWQSSRGGANNTVVNWRVLGSTRSDLNIRG